GLEEGGVRGSLPAHAPPGRLEAIESSWIRSRRRAKARFEAAARAPRQAAEDAEAQHGAHHAAHAARCALAANSAIRSRIPGALARGQRTGRLPRLSLLDPARSRPFRGRVGGQGSAWSRDEVGGDPARADGEPRVRTRWSGLVRTLPPARAAHAARGAP